MSTTTVEGPQLPEWVKEEWKAAYVRVKGFVIADRLWTRILTPDERERLGGDFLAAYEEYSTAAGMWGRLRGVSVPQAVMDVCVALNLTDAATAKAVLRELGEDPDGGLDRAIASEGLVLAESPRRMWWRGVPVDVDWVRWNRSWVIMDTLARASKRGVPFDRLSLDSNSKDLAYLKKAVSRLINLHGFPEDLGGKVRPAGLNTYQLDVPPELVRIFESSSGDELVEWLP